MPLCIKESAGKLNLLRQMEFPSLINLTSLFHFKGCLVVYFTFIIGPDKDSLCT